MMSLGIAVGEKARPLNKKSRKELMGYWLWRGIRELKLDIVHSIVYKFGIQKVTFKRNVYYNRQNQASGDLVGDIYFMANGIHYVINIDISNSREIFHPRLFEIGPSPIRGWTQQPLLGNRTVAALGHGTVADRRAFILKSVDDCLCAVQMKA